MWRKVKGPSASPPPPDFPAINNPPSIDVVTSGQPLQGCVAVVERCWIWMLRGKSIFDAGRQGTQLRGHLPHRAVIHRRRPRHITSAVNPQQSRRPLAQPCWPVNPHTRGGRHRNDLHVAEGRYPTRDCHSGAHKTQVPREQPSPVGQEMRSGPKPTTWLAIKPACQTIANEAPDRPPADLAPPRRCRQSMPT